MKYIKTMFKTIFEDPYLKGMFVAGLIVIFVSIANYTHNMFSPKEVTIDGSKFECTMPDSHGIETICRQYTQIKGVR